MDINFVKEQFEIAKKASHLSQTIVIDVKTAEWLISEIERLEKEIEALIEDGVKQSIKYQTLLNAWVNRESS